MNWLPWGERYEVSSCGRVRNRKTKRLLRQHSSDSGYRQVKLVCDDGVRRWKKVHVLVLELFVGPRPSSRHVGAHAPDRSKRNNRAENLRWATPEENEADKKAHGTATGGRPRALGPEQLEDIAARVSRNESFARIAKVHRIHRSSVPRALKRFQERKAS